MSSHSEGYEKKIIKEFLGESIYLKKLNGKGLDWGSVKAFCIAHLPKNLSSVEKNNYCHEMVDEIVTKVAMRLGKKVECITTIDFEKGKSKKYFRFVLD